jgi:hypothetical protein
MIRRIAVLLAAAIAALLLAASAASAAKAENCGTEPRPECFGIESVNVALSSSISEVRLRRQLDAHELWRRSVLRTDRACLQGSPTLRRRLVSEPRLVVARVGTIAGIYPTFIDFRVRSEKGMPA